MPPRRRPASPNRCTFKEGGRRCIYNGTSTRPGAPVLCRAHLLDYEHEGSAADVVGRVMNGQRVTPQDIIGGVADFIRQAFGGAPTQPPPWDRGGGPFSQRWPAPDPGFANPPPPRAAPPPPRPPPVDPAIAKRRIALAAARRTLGFTVGEKLDATMVKRRYRELARKYHPDHGGSDEKMKKLNAAFELLTGPQ